MFCAALRTPCQEVKLGPCIIPDEPVGKKVLEQVACIKDPDGYMFEVSYCTVLVFVSNTACVYRVLYRTCSGPADLGSNVWVLVLVSILICLFRHVKGCMRSFECYFQGSYSSC